jgi:hypothetical protein
MVCEVADVRERIRSDDAAMEVPMVASMRDGPSWYRAM